MKKLSVYVHIPFCASKCSYCDFLSFAGCSKNLLEGYADALIKEIDRAAAEFTDYKTDTVFFGGGTPTFLPAVNLVKTLDALREPYHIVEDAEITTEANPESLDFDKLGELRAGGFNRLSIGVQSFDDTLLSCIGRIHSSGKARQSFEDARRAGFDNINLDLMFSLPGQDIGDWERTLDEACSLDPEHISCYSLTLEPGTRLGDEGCNQDEDADRAMYALAKEKLIAAGYEHYEISNFAKPGYRCRHNLIYWTGYEYRGFGLGAHSLTDGVRWHNETDLNAYIKSAGKGGRLNQEPLRERDLISEFMFLGLRLIDGINCEVFLDKFDKNIYEVYGDQLNSLINRGLIERDAERIKLTSRGLDIANKVFIEFI
ncbi:MAG: radical SAM family heme chaperone HemW [Clostridiales bacterium]|jgi:oxygen-independent coproporphyrinogen-3 oxidase|nr:radical SAM family heme chaperone HemW [Clostridiales bacterium]